MTLLQTAAQRVCIPIIIGLLAGCTLAPSAGEERAHTQLAGVDSTLHPTAGMPALPELSPESPLADFVRFAVLNHPRVEAAYLEWRASVSDIAPTRALPDPQFTLQADVADTLMSFMPGLMFDLMGPGKRVAMGNEMTAASAVAHRAFISAVLGAAAEVQRAWIELAYAGGARQLHLAAIANLEQSLAVAESDYSTARMMASLDSQVRLQNQIAEQRAQYLAVDDRIAAAKARFKSALGLAPTDIDPLWPAASLASTTLPSEDELWQHTLAANPDLARMRAMVEMTVAGVEVARQTGRPNFAVGGMVDLRANPLMVRPTASISLPIWREKIAATIAAAEARRDAAAANLSAEELTMAAGLARMLYMVREADRMLAYIDSTALPNLDRLAVIAEASYQSGSGSAAMIIDAQHMALLMRLERLEALRQRENAVTDLLLMSAGIAPPDLPRLTSTGSPTS